MINLYVKLRNHTCRHLVLLLLILMDFIILPAQLLEGDHFFFNPFPNQPTSGVLKKSGIHYLHHGHPHLKSQCLTPLLKHTQRSSDEASSSPTPRQLSQASEYIFLWIIKHLLSSLWQGCRRAVPLPCTSLCLKAAQPPFVNQFVKWAKKHKGRLKFLYLLVWGMSS